MLKKNFAYSKGSGKLATFKGLWTQKNFKGAKAGKGKLSTDSVRITPAAFQLLSFQSMQEH